MVRRGPGDRFWRWGLQALLADWLGAVQPWAKRQAWGGARVEATWTILLCPITSERQAAAWGGDSGRGQKAKTRVSGLPLSKGRTGPRTHLERVGCHEELLGRQEGNRGPGNRAPALSHDAVRTPALLCSCSVITEITEVCFRLQSL